MGLYEKLEKYQTKVSDKFWYSGLGEAYYNDLFSAWLETRDPPFKVMQRTYINGVEFDIIAWRQLEKPKGKYRIISIELKKREVDKVIQQAIIRSFYIDYVYVGFWINGWLGWVFGNIFGWWQTICENNIGILLYDDLRHMVWTVKNATISKNVCSENKQLIVDVIEGKVENPRLLLEKYKQECSKISDYT